MPAKVHVHKYVRAIGRLTKENKDSGFVGYYRCADANCSHYTKAELILGKRSICNRCGEEFILPLALRMLGNRPHCKDCTKSYIVERGTHAIPSKNVDEDSNTMAAFLDELDIE